MKITKDTKIAEILETYGDVLAIRDVLEIKNEADFAFRMMMGKSASVEKVARVRGKPLDELLTILNEAATTAN